MVIAKEEEREASKENRGREARSGKRRQLERDRVGMGAFSRGGRECKEPSKKQRAQVNPPSVATCLRPQRGLARVSMMRSQYPRSMKE